MAKKISINAAEAFRIGKRYSNSNTNIVVDSDGNVSMILFGNRIAVRTADNRLFVTTAGWNTTTTRGRLSEIRGISVRSRRGAVTINGSAWDGRWIEIVDANPITIYLKNDPPPLKLK